MNIYAEETSYDQTAVCKRVEVYRRFAGFCADGVRVSVERSSSNLSIYNNTNVNVEFSIKYACALVRLKTV